MEENNQNEEKKYANDSDFWHAVVMGEEKAPGAEDEVDEDIPVDKENRVFRCMSCTFVYDLNNPPKGINIEAYIIPTDPPQIQCPGCGKRVPVAIYQGEQAKKFKEEKKKKEDAKQKKIDDKKREAKLDSMKDDLKELAEDLRDRLFSNEIDARRFAVIFTYTARNIVNRYNKDIGLDWIEVRKVIYSLSDGVLKSYNEHLESEELIEQYDSQIESDELYIAECKYYIEDDRFAIPDYELKQRLKEYDKAQEQMSKAEYEKEIEEKYQTRRDALIKKAEERQRRKGLRAIV